VTHESSLVLSSDVPQRLLLVMGDQGVAPSKVLADSGSYPGERLWGYRPLIELLGTERVAAHYVGIGSPGILKQALSHLAVKILGDLRILSSLAWQLWKERQDTQAVFITANSAISTALTLRALALRYRVYPLLLGWVEFKFPQMSHWRRCLWLSLLRKADGVLALGLDEADALRRLGLENVRFLAFGVDTDFWRPGDCSPKDYVFSVGADPHRDFETFIAATVGFPTLLCARPEAIKHIRLHDQVTVVQGSQLDVRRWFQEAGVLVVPVKDTIRPSGQNCILQAMATGKAVITTRTRGRWTDKLRDGENCVLVPPGDCEALRQAIHALYDDPGRAAEMGRRARQTVLEHFTVARLAHAIALVTEMLEAK
jgi:glycosyltransferase involved in cell wall biosynthesis